jgi:hypothetical protein
MLAGLVASVSLLENAAAHRDDRIAAYDPVARSAAADRQRLGLCKRSRQQFRILVPRFFFCFVDGWILRRKADPCPVEHGGADRAGRSKDKSHE